MIVRVFCLVSNKIVTKSNIVTKKPPQLLLKRFIYFDVIFFLGSYHYCTSIFIYSAITIQDLNSLKLVLNFNFFN